MTRITGQLFRLVFAGLGTAGLAACAAGRSGEKSDPSLSSIPPATKPENLSPAERSAYDKTHELLDRAVSEEHGPTLSLTDLERLPFKQEGICKLDRSGNCLPLNPFWWALADFLRERQPCLSEDFTHKFLQPAAEQKLILESLVGATIEASIRCASGTAASPEPSEGKKEIALCSEENRLPGPEVIFAKLSGEAASPTQEPPPPEEHPKEDSGKAPDADPNPAPKPKETPKEEPPKKDPGPPPPFDLKSVRPDLFSSGRISAVEKGKIPYQLLPSAKGPVTRQESWGMIMAPPDAVVKRLLSGKPPGFLTSRFSKTAGEIIAEAKANPGEPVRVRQYFETEAKFQGGKTVKTQGAVRFNTIIFYPEGYWKLVFSKTTMTEPVKEGYEQVGYEKGSYDVYPYKNGTVIEWLIDIQPTPETPTVVVKTIVQGIGEYAKETLSKFYEWIREGSGANGYPGGRKAYELHQL